MLVYRVEQKDSKVGPFQYGNVDDHYRASTLFDEVLDQSDALPVGMSDGIEYDSDLVFAFPSKVALDAIIPPAIVQALTTDYSFVVRELDVPDEVVKRGYSGFQVAFPKDYL